MNHIEEDLRWLNLIRDTEYESAIQNLSDVQINTVLELGSGTGYILGKLKKYIQVL